MSSQLTKSTKTVRGVSAQYSGHSVGGHASVVFAVTSRGPKKESGGHHLQGKGDESQVQGPPQSPIHTLWRCAKLAEEVHTGEEAAHSAERAQTCQKVENSNAQSRSETAAQAGANSYEATEKHQSQRHQREKKLAPPQVCSQEILFTVVVSRVFIFREELLLKSEADTLSFQFGIRLFKPVGLTGDQDAPPPQAQGPVQPVHSVSVGLLVKLPVELLLELGHIVGLMFDGRAVELVPVLCPHGHR